MREYWLLLKLFPVDYERIVLLAKCIYFFMSMCYYKVHVSTCFIKFAIQTCCFFTHCILLEIDVVGWKRFLWICDFLKLIFLWGVQNSIISFHSMVKRQIAITILNLCVNTVILGGLVSPLSQSKLNSFLYSRVCFPQSKTLII